MSLTKASQILSTNLGARYEVAGLLAEGGAGKVFRVYDRGRDLDLALKFVQPSESSWLRREFNTLRSIRHENLIRVFDFSALGSGEAFYTMELIQGGSLSDQLREINSEGKLRAMLMGILRGLGHLHCHREVHGDLKPGNVLLGTGGVIKVTDIGMGAEARSSFSPSGTPGYTAPEVWNGGAPSPRSDFYSVGVLAYEILAGKHPFSSRTIRDVISNQIEGWVPSMTACGVVVPRDLDRAVMRALERDPYLRFGSADEFLEAIGASETVGEIVTGRIAAREGELRALETFVRGEDPRGPTLLYLCGPPGIGKSALLGELSAESTIPFHSVREPERDLLDLAGLSLDHQAAGPLIEAPGVSRLAEALMERAEREPVVVIHDSPATGELIRSVARFAWADSVERGLAPKVHFIVTMQIPPKVLEPFEGVVPLGPLGPDSVRDLVRGLLGDIEPDAAFASRMFHEFGGNPGSLSAAVLELVDMKVLRRRLGRWETGILSDHEWAGLKAGASRWQVTWGKLADQEKDALTMVGVVPYGLRREDIECAMNVSATNSPLARLQALGWLESQGGRLILVSREATRVVLADERHEHSTEMRRRLLHALKGKLTREEIASLLVEGKPSAEAITEGLWLGRKCRERRRFREALSVLDSVRRMARAVGGKESLVESLLLSAEILVRIGSSEEALELLGNDIDWNNTALDPNVNAERAMLQGLSLKAKRDVDGSRDKFRACAHWAYKARNQKLRLQAEAELAELEWRHGGEIGRNAVMERVRILLDTRRAGDGCRDEWAALEYQLGASLVMAGRRDEAVAILQNAVANTVSNYWQMRICNALSAAQYYLGDLQAALVSSERAWKHAVDGEIDSFKPRILSSIAAVRFGLGQFREAADQDEMSAVWGRRLGNPFEHEAGLLAAASDLIQIAAFDRAVEMADEAEQIAKAADFHRHIAKALEMKAQALLHIGDLESAAGCIERATSALLNQGYDDTMPRLQWHAARVALERGMYPEAEERLKAALTILEHTKDWEDLPGVQVEMQLLFARSGDQRLDTEELHSIVERARRMGLCLVQLRATLVLAETVGIYPNLYANSLAILEDGLRLAERAGAKEFVWRMNYWIGKSLARSGNERAAFSRISNAVRVLGEVASGLTDRSRSFYLTTSHARLLLTDGMLVRG